MSKNIDWSSLGFGYVQTDKRFVSNYKNGAWDDGVLTEDATVNLSECAGVLQYAQTCFEGLKAYTTEKGQIVIFRPDLNASRMADSCKRLEMPVYPEDKWVDASRFFGYCEKKLDFLMRSAYTVCTDSKIELEIAKQ